METLSKHILYKGRESKYFWMNVPLLKCKIYWTTLLIFFFNFALLYKQWNLDSKEKYRNHQTNQVFVKTKEARMTPVWRF